VLAAAVGVVTGAVAMVLAWMTSGSLGLGRLSHLGAPPLQTALYVACEVAVGVVIGHSVAPWLEREQLSGYDDAPSRRMSESFSASKSAD